MADRKANIVEIKQTAFDNICGKKNFVHCVNILSFDGIIVFLVWQINWNSAVKT